MHKEVKFALTVGGVLLCTIIVYALILSGGGGAPDANVEAITAGPATAPASAAPAAKSPNPASASPASHQNTNAPSANASPQRHAISHTTDSPKPTTRATAVASATPPPVYPSPRLRYNGNYNYNSNYSDGPTTHPSVAIVQPPASRPQPSGSASSHFDWETSLATGATHDSTAAGTSPTVEPQRTMTPTINYPDATGSAPQHPVVVNNPHPAIIDTPSTQQSTELAQAAPATLPSRAVASIAKPVAPPSDPPAAPVYSSPTTRSANISTPPSIATATPPPTVIPSPAPAHASPSPDPTATNARTHVIASGESLWTIAAAAYGNGAFYTKIVTANPGLDSKHLKIGKVLVLPDVAATRDKITSSAAPSESSSPKSNDSTIDPDTQYRVESGDTLERIAKRLYGTSVMKDKIYDLNKFLIGADPDKLKIGWILKLPQPPQSAQ